MTAALILWGHALAALAFGLVALDRANRARGGWPKAALIVALAATGLWALTVAGLDARDVASAIAVTIRDLAWFVLMGLVVRRDASAGIALAAVYAMAAAMAIAGTTVALADTVPMDAAGHAALADAQLICRMLAAATALVMVHHLHQAKEARARGLARPLTFLLGAIWAWDLLTAAAGYFGGARPEGLIAIRGFALAGVALVFGVAAKTGAEWRLAMSRGAALRMLAVAALVAYAAATVLLTAIAERAPPGYVRIVQTAIVLGSATALMTLLSTPWLRAWTRVTLAKHLFRHRYDYRTEWQRFTATLGVPGPDADPLDRRIVKAIADLTNAPAGLLLIAHGDALAPAARWRWEGGDDGDGDGEGHAALGSYLERTARIVELDAVRRTPDGEEAAAIPGWMTARADAWVLVPLIHHSALVGVILLARPPVEHALDWEDLDLLRVAGRQAASYLAEDRAHGALADAARFDEFNRRFAFILHDIKNLVSGLALVARNAERHAGNPEFRADMIATLRDSVARMNALLGRLSQNQQAAAEPVRPVDVAALATRMAAARRAQHPVEATGAGIALAQPARLEQVLAHLVQNAIDASPMNETVLLQVAAAGGRVTIDIVDRGCGMSAAFVRDDLFRPFSSSKPAGFGIGAYEARQLAEAMGGRISVASREGAGTRFTVSLPAAAVLEAAA